MVLWIKRQTRRQSDKDHVWCTLLVRPQSGLAVSKCISRSTCTTNTRQESSEAKTFPCGQKKQLREHLRANKDVRYLTHFVLFLSILLINSIYKLYMLYK